MNTFTRATVLLLALTLQAVPALAAKKSSGQQAAQAADPSAQSLIEFFKSETTTSPKRLDFRIQGGYADIQSDKPESSGRYYMAGQTILSVAQDIYKIELVFKKKYQRDVIDLAPEYFFTESRTYYFWYDGGDRIVFKLGSGRKEIKIAKKNLTQIKVKSLETYSIEKTPLQMDFVLPDGGAKVFLQVQFL